MLPQGGRTIVEQRRIYGAPDTRFTRIMPSVELRRAVCCQLNPKRFGSGDPWNTTAQLRESQQTKLMNQQKKWAQRNVIKTGQRQTTTMMQRTVRTTCAGCALKRQEPWTNQQQITHAGRCRNGNLPLTHPSPSPNKDKTSELVKFLFCPILS